MEDLEIVDDYCSAIHCTENQIYVFPEKELQAASVPIPTFICLKLSVSDLYISRNWPHIWLQQNRQTDPGNI